MTQSLVGKRFGVIDDDRQRALSRLEFVQGLVDGTLPLNTMAQTLGYDIVEVAKGRVVAAAELPTPGTAIPPARFTAACPAQPCSTAPWGSRSNPCWTRALRKQPLKFKISLLRPITPQTGLVKAEGKVISCGRRVGTAEGKLTDKDGRVLAHGTTTCLIYEH